MSRTRIVLADDHPVVRAGMKALLDQPDLEVVAEAGDGAEALERATALAPDVAVVDYNVPRLSGAEVVARLRQADPAVRVLILSVHDDGAILRQVLEAGAQGYVLKRAAGGELAQAVRAVAAGGVYVDPALTRHLVNELVQPPAGPGGPGLTPREAEVLRLVALGHLNKEVATMLDVSVKTVETHKARGDGKARADRPGGPRPLRLRARLANPGVALSERAITSVGPKGTGAQA